MERVMKRMVVTVDLYVETEARDLGDLEDALGAVLWPDLSPYVPFLFDVRVAEVVKQREVEAS